MSTHVTLMNHLHLTSYVRKKNHLQDTFGKIRPWNVCCVSCTHNRDGIIFLFLMRKRCPIFAGPWIAGVNFHGTALFSEQISQPWGFVSSMSALEVRVSCVLSCSSAEAFFRKVTFLTLLGCNTLLFTLHYKQFAVVGYQSKEKYQRKCLGKIQSRSNIFN